MLAGMRCGRVIALQERRKEFERVIMSVAEEAPGLRTCRQVPHSKPVTWVVEEGGGGNGFKSR